jgi:hypothetical protein
MPATYTTVTMTLLLARHVSAAQAQRVANDTGCELLRVSVQTAELALQGTPQHLERAARLVLSMHVSKDAAPKLTLAAEQAQVDAIHESAAHSRGLLELKKRTRCAISMSTSQGTLRKLYIQGGSGESAAPVDLVAGAVRAIAEIWQGSGTTGGLTAAATPVPVVVGQKRLAERDVDSHAPPMQSLCLDVPPASDEQLRKRAARFSMDTSMVSAKTVAPSPAAVSAASGAAFVSDEGANEAALRRLQEEKVALEARNRQLQADLDASKQLQADLEAARSTQHAQVVEAPPQMDRRQFDKQRLAFRAHVAMLRSHAGKGAETEWKNFVVRRDITLPAFTAGDVGKSVDIEGGECEQDPSQIRLGGAGVAAAKHRLVEWGVIQPHNTKNAEIVSVEERIGGNVTIRLPASSIELVTFDNPTGGLINDVLGFMAFGSGDRGFSRQDFFKPTRVRFEGEGGIDEGGLTQEMFASFWRGIIRKEVGLFETADSALPSASASEERLQLVGQFLCKSVLLEVPTGRGLCPFVFEFLLEETDRSFDTTLPPDKQTAAALRALRAYDSVLYEQFNTILAGYLNGAEVAGAFKVGDFVPNSHQYESPVTKDNVQSVIVAACKYRLWDQQEDQLLALRRGFKTDNILSKEPIDLLHQLRPFQTPDLMLLVQGRPEPLSVAELIEQCITWPDESRTAVADNGGGFPTGSTTVVLLRALLEDESEFTADDRERFVEWATARSVVPDAGLVNTDGGKIKIKWDETPRDDDEAMWPLPRVSTCFHSLYLANFSRLDVLKNKLLTAMESSHFEEAEND